MVWRIVIFGMFFFVVLPWVELMRKILRSIFATGDEQNYKML